MSADLALSQKIHAALDDTRIFMLGAQILYGFQLMSVFSERFEGLPRHARYLDGVALLFMIAAIMLLIMPQLYHWIADRGASTRTMLALLSRMGNISLVPFTLSFGIILGIMMEHIVGELIGFSIAAAMTIIAACCWFGIPYALKQTTGGEDNSMKHLPMTAHPPLQEKITHLLTESRVILPGIQATLGFQLSIILTSAFERLPESSQLIHLASLCAVVLATILLMTPAAYHRVAHGGEDSEDMLRTGSRLLIASTLPLALGLCGDIYVVAEKITASPIAGIATASSAFAIILSFWYFYPLGVAYARRKATSTHNE
ncbi:MAG: DUF6328 family protein [Bdellovibrionales bacterium]